MFSPVVWLALLPLIRGDSNLDATRTGSYYTNFPIYRSGSGTNVVKVEVGTPGIKAQLTLSTNVNFIQIVSTQCSGCSDENLFDTSRSSTWASSSQDQVNIIVYPQVPEDTLTLTSRLGIDVVLDARGQTQVSYPVAAVDKVESGRDGQGEGSGSDVGLGRGVSGFYGLGVNQQDRQLSIVSTMLNAENYPPNQPVPKSFIVGFDIGSYNNQPGSSVGNMHWGAVPQGKWVGDFNWYESNRTVGGSWGVAVSNIRMGGNVVDITQLYATIDPAFDGIYVPTRIAEQLFTNIQGARRDATDPRRWTIPCNFIQSMSITIQGATYNFNPSQLVQPNTGQTCYSQVQAWTNGSVAEEQGEIRLGTSFMSGVYAAIYYSPNQQFVGLAGKPGSVNDFNLAAPSRGGMPNMKLAGILIGTLLGALLILFVICYSRNRSSVQSVWSRGVRRMQRAQMNAVVRTTTIPAPMMGVPGPMIGRPGMMQPGLMGPIGMGPGMMAGPGMIPGGPGMMGGAPGMIGGGFGGGFGGGHPVPIGGYPRQVPHQGHWPSDQQPQPFPSTQPIRHSLPAVHRQEKYSPQEVFSNPSTDTPPDRRKRDRHSASVPRRHGEEGPARDSDRRTRPSSREDNHALPRQHKHLPSHPETGYPRSTPPPGPLRASYRTRAQPLYDPMIPSRPIPTQHPNHRNSRPEYDHAPPGSATNQSLWNFGKAQSVARGYEAVPRHASTTFEHSGGDVRPSRSRWFGRRGRVDEADVADEGSGGRGDWNEVERNREQEGLTAAKAWGR